MATRNVAADVNAFKVAQRHLRVSPGPKGTLVLTTVLGSGVSGAAPISGDALKRAVAMYRRSPGIPRTRALGYVQRGAA
ncbi:hypothetical protein [Brevibacterium sp.]|uniref:hypothetical protein n=1 Tax=Brevibacterium sp. TaxID=1701 RepID=UPI0028119697|nr:hypothetical protein [Brevibacterium sp.]